MSGTIAAAPTYPWVICNAVTRVFDVEELRKLHDSAIKLLVSLIKKVDKNNGTSPIFARRETLAKDIGRSVETVYRGLRILEESGLIEEREQSQDATGRLADSVITLSTRACELLQLPVRQGTSRCRVAPSVTSGRPTVYRLDSQFFEDQSSESAEERVAQKQERQSIRVGKFWIPADLGLLIDRNVVATAVLALMKRAKVAGKRLSDVVQCVANRVVSLDLRAKKLYAYLLAAIEGSRDYSRDATTLRQDAERAKELEALQVQRTELDGTWLKPANDDATRLKVDKGVVYVFERAEMKWKMAATIPFGKDIAAAIEAGRLAVADALTVDSYL